MAKESYKILIAEDNTINQQVVEILCKRLGYQCDVVFDGEEAVELIKKTNFDLILMDIQMPVMDGYTATQIIRKELGINNLPIIALTANTFNNEKERCIET